MPILKSIIFALISVVFINFTFAESLNVKIYDTKSQKFISSLDLFIAVPRQGQLILGEEHYQEAIQKAEKDIIGGVLLAQFREINFSTCWEFLNYPNQKIITSTFLQFQKQLISISGLFEKLFIGLKPEVHHSYRHLFDVTRSFKGKVIGINAPRKWKRVITKNGLASLDKKLIPANMELGGAFYKERFMKAIGNHASPEKASYYFEAQSYTDSVMANSIQSVPQNNLKFVVVGSFHSDYNDGLVAQLKKYNSGPTTTIKIINTTNFSEKEKENWLNPHPKYGVIADYIYMLDGV